MSKRPELLHISPYDYRVRMEPDLSAKAGVLGLCNTDLLTLFLDASMPEMVEVETLLHESLHAMWTQTTLDKKYTDEQEEEIIWCLTPRLLALLLDNPRLVKWMTDGGR